MLIDAKNMILGRLATRVAKLALKGEEIRIVNCESAVMTGKQKAIFARYKQKNDFGAPLVGPFLPKMPDRFVRRAIRGMLPYKQEKGRVAYKRIMCYIGIPDEFKDKELKKFIEADITTKKIKDYVTIERISKYLGVKE